MSKSPAANAKDAPPSPRLAVVGGGITGLMAAYYAVKNGQDPASIDLYEASGNYGGKIQNAELNGVKVNRGAEFVDSTNARLRAVCKDMKDLGFDIELERCADQQSQVFQKPDGTVIPNDEFMAQYRPIAEAIIRDKQAIAADPDGEVAQRLNSMNAEQYLQHLGATTVPAEDKRSYFAYAMDTLMFRRNRVDPAIISAAASAFSAECGQPASNINAMQVAMEAGATPDAFLESDCAFRIKGGSASLIKALQTHLAGKGVNFHENARLESIEKSDGGLSLGFAGGEDGKGRSARADKVIMALPAYQMGKVRGLENLGMSAADIKALSGLQHTKSMKFTVAVPQGSVKWPTSNFFSNAGYQCWQSSPGQITFLCNMQDGVKPDALIKKITAHFSQAQGRGATPISATPESMVFTNPGQAPCYPTSGVGQMIPLLKLRGQQDALAQNGVAIAGNYFPMYGLGKRMGLGFMECGLDSAMEATMRLCPPTRGQEQELTSRRQLPPAPQGRPHSRA